MPIYRVFFINIECNIFLKPWPTGVTSQHKFANVNLRTQTCDQGGKTDSRVDANSTQVAKKPFQCSLARAPVQRKTILKPTSDDSLWVAANGEKLALT